MSWLRSFLISTSLSVSLSSSLFSLSLSILFHQHYVFLSHLPLSISIRKNYSSLLPTLWLSQPSPVLNLKPPLMCDSWHRFFSLSLLTSHSILLPLVFSSLLCKFNTFKDRYGCSSNHTGVPSQCQSEGWQSRENWSWILLPTLHRWVREEYTFIPVFSFCLSLVFRSYIESGTSKSFVENHFIFLSIHCVLPFLISLLMPTSENRILVVHTHTCTHTHTHISSL